MKKMKILTLAMILPLLFLVFVAGCAKKTATGGESNKGSAAGKPGGDARQGRGDAMRGPSIETAVAAIKPILLEKQYVGAITPFYTVDLKSTTSGWLKSINVDTGDSVKKNGVICEIENDDLKAQVEQSEAGISVSKASVSRAEVDLDRIRLENDRSERLYEKGYISKQELEQSRAAEKLAEAALESAKSQLDLSTAQLKNIKVKLRDSTVKAPFTGVVAERYVDPGAYVSPANPIVRLEDGEKVKALINVVEEDFSRVHRGVRTGVLIDSYPTEKFDGVIVRISPSMNTSSRTSEVEILMPNGGGKLKSGMTARVNLVLSKNPSALVVPENALRRDVEKDFSYVFVVNKGTAALRKVETGIVSSGEVEITGGLKPGDVVITGDVRISDGMKIGKPRGKGGRR
jgi:RND family efflux transporter MFP subunit